MRDVTFQGKCFKQYREWSQENTAIFERINELILDILRDPFKGIGKPEPLKGQLAGYWSRRINDKHRLIYKVEQDAVIIVKCHGHYDD